MRFSIVIPARNESHYLPACLDSIETACTPYEEDAEVIVVVNRCTDSTEEIALSRGFKTAHDESRNLSKVRNAGARQATGDILITIDADSVMSSNMLVEVDRALRSRTYIGGGVPIRPERMSAGILLSALMIYSFLPFGVSAGMFWCLRSDFDAIGGFDENLVIAEDVNFALRLKAHGKHCGKRYGTLRKAHIKTSCRKFDRFGDWFLVKQPLVLWHALRGREDGLADRLFYDFER